MNADSVLFTIHIIFKQKEKVLFGNTYYFFYLKILKKVLFVYLASALAEKHLTSDACFNVQDSRTPNISREEIINVAKSAHFSVTTLPCGFNLHNDTKYFEHMLAALKKLGEVLPKAITREQVEAVIYKVSHGALDDESSYADEPNIIFKLDLSIRNNTSTMLICRSTTIN